MNNAGFLGNGMDDFLTEHVRDVMEKRHISIEWLAKTISSPEWIESDHMDEDLKHFLARIPDFQDRVLRVIVNMNTNPKRVVMVYFDRRRTGK